MVKHNLSLALTAAARLKKEAPEQYAALSLSKAECAAWEILRDAIQLPRDPITGHYRQDDTFHLLERVEPAELKSGERGQLSPGLLRPAPTLSGDQAGGYVASL